MSELYTEFFKWSREVTMHVKYGVGTCSKCFGAPIPPLPPAPGAFGWMPHDRGPCGSISCLQACGLREAKHHVLLQPHAPKLENNLRERKTSMQASLSRKHTCANEPCTCNSLAHRTGSQCAALYVKHFLFLPRLHNSSPEAPQISMT